MSDDTSVPGFTDVLTTDWFYDDFAQSQAAGVVVASADQRFRPYSKVSRALFAVYMVRAMAPNELAKLDGAALAGPPTFRRAMTMAIRKGRFGIMRLGSGIMGRLYTTVG